jgi:hypothetical protein
MEIETTRLTPYVRQKYVLVRVMLDTTEGLILWGNPNIQWHKDIVDEIARSGYEIGEILGGGWLLPKPDEGSVFVWGTSDRYGLAPISLVRTMLKDTVVEQEPS